MPDRENVSAKYGRVLSGEFSITMQNNLYVSSLSWDTKDDSLRAYFQTVGTVTSASVIKDKMSQRSRGFGFVEMASAEEAAKAVEMLNNTDLDGRTIRVAIAEPREERPRREFNGPRDGENGASHSSSY